MRDKVRNRGDNGSNHRQAQGENGHGHRKNIEKQTRKRAVFAEDNDGRIPSVRALGEVHVPMPQLGAFLLQRTQLVSAVAAFQSVGIVLRRH